jgi:hypothetical protein
LALTGGTLALVVWGLIGAFNFYLGATELATAVWVRRNPIEA